MAYDFFFLGLGVHFHEGVFGYVADFLGGRYFLDTIFRVFFGLFPFISCLFDSFFFAFPVVLNGDDFEEHSPDVEPGE